MSAKYKLVERRDFSKDAPEGSKKTYAQLTNNGTVSFDELCKDIAEETAQTTADVKSCVDRFAHHVSKHIKEGRLVQAGELGSFMLAVGSTGAESADKFNAATMMKKPKVQFNPGRLLQEARSQVTFERVGEKKDKPSGGEDDRPVIE